MPENPEGVWVTYFKDNGPHITSVHLTEVEALREAVEYGYKVRFLKFGEDMPMSP